MKTKTAFISWSMISFLLIINLMVFDFTILRSKPSLRVQFTPDDTYYYLQLAKNFTKLGYWTFDSGVSSASGFHPLLAYFLAAIYKVFHPSIEGFVTVSIAINSVPTLVLVIGVWLKSVFVKKSNSLAALSLLIAAQSFLFNSVSGVEWSLVIVLAGLYCFFFVHFPPSRSRLFYLYAIGLLLSLARSDAGLLPFSIFVVALFFAILVHREHHLYLWSSLIGLTGAVSGLVLVFVNDFIFTGSILQSSAQMKLHWGGFQENLLAKSLIVIMRTVGFDVYLFPFSILFFSALLFAAVTYLAFLFLERKESVCTIKKIASKIRGDKNRAILYLASFTCVIAYIALYAQGGGGLQNWYTANFVVPTFILCAFIIKLLVESAPFKKGIVEVVLSAIFVYTIALNILSVYPINNKAPWPHQQATLLASKYLNENRFDGNIGSWNSGVLGYYHNGNIINIDGLVNESIYPYVISNTLPTYLKQKNILYVIDFQTMLTPLYRKRGGYDDPDFLKKLTPIIQFDEGQFPVWKHLTLYRIQNQDD